MTANTPPKPHTEGMEWTNTETGIKYMFANGGWRAVSSEASEEVADAISKLDLQTVLDNGNVADKGIVLTNASDDALLLSPEDARIMVGGIGPSVVPRLELRHEAGLLDTSIVKLELDEDGSRFDIECDEKVDNIHFRFENDVKFELNKTGDAVFSGDVDIQGSAKTNGITNQGDALFKLSSGDTVVMESGSSYLPMLTLKSYSGPGERKEVFNVNASGSATLLGKLSLAPGEADNQAVTYGQLLSVQEQIEQIVPAYERGKYNISQEEVTTNSATRGRYNLIRKNNSADTQAQADACQNEYDVCLRNPDNSDIECLNNYSRCMSQIPEDGTYDVYITSFSDVEQVRFSQFDADGAKHEWNDVVPGQLIDIFNDDNDDYYVGEITAIAKSNNYVTLDVDKVQAKGNATGAARIKVFTLDNDIEELANYVRKSGDEMTGKLTLEQSGSGNDVILVKDPNGNDFLSLGSDSDTLARFQVKSNKQFKINTPQRQIFKIYSDSTCILGGLREPTDASDAATKKYVDDNLFKPAKYMFRVDTQTNSAPEQGHIAINGASFGSTTQLRISTKSIDHNLDLYEIPQGKVLYEWYKPGVTGEYVSSMTVSAWYRGNDTDNKWKWKGTADIKKITSQGAYLLVDLHDNQKTNNGTFSNNTNYYFTIPGLF
jgi:hypothetical protein